MAANQPGDGKTCPNGDGKGGSGMAKQVPNNYVSNPKGGPKNGAKPRDFTRDQQKPVTTGVPYSPDSVPAGGPLPLIDSNDPDATHPVGKNSRKPFKVGA